MARSQDRATGTDRGTVTLEPGPIYHGSPVVGLSTIISQADIRGDESLNHGIYSTSQLDYARQYAGPTGSVYVVRLSFDNPLVFRNRPPAPFGGIIFPTCVLKRHAALLQSRGYDALIDCGRFIEYVVFDRAQITILDEIPAARHGAQQQGHD